ncbi:MAG: biotin synthase, partial [Magnetococcales bacterium]|nr:biotin synthase [Magnetococcales bacterium]
MSLPVVLLHGWGFGPGVWRAMQRCLPDLEWHTLDLGFYRTPNLSLPANTPFIAIGHSLGFLWLSQRLHDPEFATRCRGLIAINGCARFARAPDFPMGVAVRVLERMIRQLHDNPIEVFFHFQRQSGLTLPLPLPDHLDIA